ncbi:MAG: beta strand repeat-containing protein, partial [Methylophagaceae bacterium]
TLPDTNTQLSDGDVAAFGYIKTFTDTNTQRTNAEIDARIALNPEGFIDAIPSAGAGAGTYGNAGNAYKIDHITLDAQGRVTAVSTGATGTTTASSIETFTNKSGSNSQWTNDEGYITSFTDTNTQLSDGDIAGFGYIKSFTDTNTQRTDEEIRDLAAGQWIDGTNTTVVYDDVSNTIKINSVNTDTNTQLSDANIAAMGYIKTESDTQDLSISGQTLSLTNGGSVTLPDTNTQRSNAEINALIDANSNGYITDGNSGWNNSYGFITSSSLPTATSDLTNDSGFITSFTNTVDMGDGFKIADSAGTDKFTVTENEEIRFAGSGATSVSFDAATQKVTISSTDTNTDTNTQLSDADIAAMGYIKTESDTQDLSISGHTISLTNGGSVTVPDNNDNTQLSEAQITAMGFIQTQSDTQDLSISGQTLSLTNGGSVTLPDTNTQLSSAQITAMGFSTTDNNTQRSDEEIRDVAAAQWIDGTNTTVVVSDAGNTIKINSVNTNTNTQLSEADITAMGFIQTQSDTQDLSISGHTISLTNGGSVTVPDNNTQRTNSEIDARIALNPEGFIDSYTDTNTQLSDANIAAMGYIKTYTDTNTQRAIHDSPVNGSTTTSISSNWAFDNVKTAVPSGALFTDTDTNTQLSDANIGAMGYIKTYTDTNTQRAIHDTPVNGSTTTSISSNWAFDNVKTAVPTGALFTDTNDNTQLTSAQITAMGFSTTDNNTFRAISSTPTNGATTTSISSDWAFDNVKTAVPANALFTDTNTNTQLTSAQITAMGFSTTDNNTFRAISSTPTNGATTTSISSDWAFDNVKTAVPAGALFTDTNTNTQLTSAQITAMGFSTTDNNDNT